MCVCNNILIDLHLVCVCFESSVAVFICPSLANRAVSSLFLAHQICFFFTSRLFYLHTTQIENNE